MSRQVRRPNTSPPRKKPCQQQPRLAGRSNPAVNPSLSFAFPLSISTGPSNPMGVGHDKRALLQEEEAASSRMSSISGGIIITPDVQLYTISTKLLSETAETPENPVFALTLPQVPRKKLYQEAHHPHSAASAPLLPISTVVENSKAQPCKTSSKAVPPCRQKKDHCRGETRAPKGNSKQPHSCGISVKPAASKLFLKGGTSPPAAHNISVFKWQEPPFGRTLPGELARSIIANMYCCRITRFESVGTRKQRDARCPTVKSSKGEIDMHVQASRQT